MDTFCEICCWYDAVEIFDDTDYTMYYRNSGERQYYNGYNSIINPNGYNRVNVCYSCLLTRVYTCDTEIKKNVLKHLVCHVAAKRIARWWLSYLYNIDKGVGRNFILRKISSDTKMFYDIN